MRTYAPFFLGLLAVVLVLPGCGRETAPVRADTSPVLAFRIDPQTMRVVRIEPTAAAVTPLDTSEPQRVNHLLRMESYSFWFGGDKLYIEASFRNTGADNLLRPFFFEPNPATSNIVGSLEPTVTDADLGGDGVLITGETTGVLRFEVTHRYRPFTYVVDGYALVKEPCVIGGGVTVVRQADADALRGCVYIGMLVIETGPNVVDLSPLGALRSVVHLQIIDNPTLTNLDGLDNLTTIFGHDWDGLRITGNHALTDIEGLRNLTTVGGGFFFFDNDALTSLDQLPGLTYVGWLGLYDTPIGMPNLTRVGFLDMGGSASSIPDLSSLTEVTRDLVIEVAPAVTNLDNLGSLTTVGRDLKIRNNAALTSITGLRSLTTVGRYSLVNDNPLLDCSLPPQPPFLPMDESTGNLVDCPVEGP